jgi:hypothetical protein
VDACRAVCARPSPARFAASGWVVAKGMVEYMLPVVALLPLLLLCSMHPLAGRGHAPEREGAAPEREGAAPMA